MPNKNNTLPIGKLLQDAGLISEEQLAMALKMQSQYTEMKLGEILALQSAVKVQTVDFFVDTWQEIEQEGAQFPLGYYFKKAYLLNDRQIKTILSEQENTQLKFGDIAVKKGLLERDTVDFFLNGLASQPPKLMSLIDLEEFDRQYLHLEQKYAACSLILSRILAWTGGNPNLTKAICNVFADSDFNIPEGMEVNAVDKLIENTLIKNWHTSQLGTYVRSLEQSLVDGRQCEPILLLEEYENVLLSDTTDYQKTKAQDELLNLGLIVKDNNRLRVTNLIFQQIFNQSWIIKQREKIQFAAKNEYIDVAKSDIIKSDVAELKEDNTNPVDERRSSIVKTDTDISKLERSNISQPKVETTETLTKFGSLLTLAAIAFLIPLVLIINNYSSLRERKISIENTSQASRAKQFCNDVDLVDSSSAIKLIYQLEKSKELILRSFPNTLEGFPDNCETALNKLRVLAAPQLGKESRVIEAIKNVCKIPADAENISEAKIWIEHWYASPSWGKETKSYLNLIDDCPASK